MIKQTDRNLLDIFAKGRLNAICHCCNVHHVMGGGIAYQIKKRFPEAYAADLETPKGDHEKLGTFSVAQTKEGLIFNLYGQHNYSQWGRQLNYEAIYNSLCNVKLYILSTKRLKDAFSLGVPYLMGCGLAGGSWKIVNSMIEDVFEDTDIDILIVKLRK